MARRRKKTLFRIVGADGEWWAWHVHERLPIWARHAREICVLSPRGRLTTIVAIRGRSPSEALDRCKRFLGGRH